LLFKKLSLITDVSHLNEKLKVALFMMLRIQDNESSSNLGVKLNKQLLKCYEKIQYSSTR
jgi:hypothetical protein